MTDYLRKQGVDCEVVRSARATRPRIEVDLSGVKVVVPRGSLQSPEEFLNEKREWVESKLAEVREKRERIPERRFVAGARWPYLGDTRTLRIKSRRGRELTESEIQLPRKQVEKKSIKTELEKFYREQARVRFEKLLERWAPELDVQPGKLYVRNQRTKWGSCSGKGNVNLNFRLMLAPPAISEYIVIHELCHLKHLNHDAEFSRLLERHCPDYAEHEQWLDENSVQLIFTRADL